MLHSPVLNDIGCDKDPRRTVTLGNAWRRPLAWHSLILSFILCSCSLLLLNTSIAVLVHVTASPELRLYSQAALVPL